MSDATDYHPLFGGGDYPYQVTLNLTGSNLRHLPQFTAYRTRRG